MGNFFSGKLISLKSYKASEYSLHKGQPGPFAELQKRKKIAPTNFFTQKISTKNWLKNDLRLPKIAQKWPKIAQNRRTGPKISTS